MSCGCTEAASLPEVCRRSDVARLDYALQSSGPISSQAAPFSARAPLDELDCRAERAVVLHGLSAARFGAALAPP